MTFKERQQFLQLVIDRVTVDNGVAHIDTRIPGAASKGQLRLRHSERSEESGMGIQSGHFLAYFLEGKAFS